MVHYLLTLAEYGFKPFELYGQTYSSNTNIKFLVIFNDFLMIV